MTRPRQNRRPRIRMTSPHSRRRRLLLDVLEDRCLLAGGMTEYGGLTPGSAPASIAAGPDDNLWFTEPGSNKIGRVTTAGSFTEYAIPTKGSGAAGIVAGPDGNLWFEFEFK